MAKSSYSLGSRSKRSSNRADHKRHKKNVFKEPGSRASHRCSLCGINGDQPNEFSGVSKYSKYTHVVYARGTEDLPKGDCLKCEFVFKVAGWLAEFGSKEKFRIERDKDPGVQTAFMRCSALWLEHHNSGKRLRVQSGNSRAKRGSNALDAIMDVRQNRKSIVKRKARRLKVKVRGKIMTPERYQACFKTTIEKAGLSPKYYTIFGKKVWGVLVRKAPEGEFEVSDEEEEGIEELEELDDGEECLRAEQQQMKYNQVATGIGDAFRDAVFMAEAMANPGGRKDGASDGDSGDGDTDEEDDDNESSSSASHTEDDGDPGLVGKALKAKVQEAPIVPAKRPAAGGSSHKGGGGGSVRSRTSRVNPIVTSPGAEQLGSDDELGTVNFTDMVGTFQAALDEMDQPAMAQLPLTSSQMSDVVKLASAAFDSLQKLIVEMCKAEHSLKRRKVVNSRAVERLSNFKSSVSAVAKILGSIKGIRTEWSALMRAWSNLPPDISEKVRKFPALVGYIVKKDAVEQAKFNQFNLLQPLLSITQNAQGLHLSGPRLAFWCFVFCVFCVLRLLRFAFCVLRLRVCVLGARV